MKNALALALAAVVVFSVSSAQAQRLHRVGVLNTGFARLNVFSPLTKSFEERLGSMGYHEGQNLVLERRYAEGKLERLPALAAELAQNQVEVFLTVGNKIQKIVQDAHPRIPMVSLSCDSFASVANYAKPNGNFTGVTCMSTELSPKRLELAKQLVPGASRAVYLHNPTQGDVGLALTLEAASRLGIAIRPVEARSPGQLKEAFAAIAAERPDVLLVYPDGLTMTQREAIAAFSAQQKLPAVYAYKEFAEAGGLVSYGSTLTELGERAADLVAKILRGARPSDLPLEQATRVYLTVNLKAARELGYQIPQAILQRADFVIE
jgi:putative tryptophan/tyrosine transport system substrate-binding protein